MIGCTQGDVWAAFYNGRKTYLLQVGKSFTRKGAGNLELRVLLQRCSEPENRRTKNSIRVLEASS